MRHLDTIRRIEFAWSSASCSDIASPSWGLPPRSDRQYSESIYSVGYGVLSCIILTFTYLNLVSSSVQWSIRYLVERLSLCWQFAVDLIIIAVVWLVRARLQESHSVADSSEGQVCSRGFNASRPKYSRHIIMPYSCASRNQMPSRDISHADRVRIFGLSAGVVSLASGPSRCSVHPHHLKFTPDISGHALVLLNSW